MANTYTAKEFQEAMKTGQISLLGKRLKYNSLNPEYEKILNKEGKLFDTKEYTKVQTQEQINSLNRELIESQKLKNEPLLNYLRFLVKTHNAIFLKNNVPSSKNSKQIRQMMTKLSVCCKKELVKKSDKKWYCTSCNQIAQRLTRPILANSDLVEKYIIDTTCQFEKYKSTFLEIIKDKTPPYNIGMYFIRDSKRVFDYNNASQIICDEMKKKEWIIDDNCLYVIPEFLGFHYDEQNGGIIICLMDKELINLKYKKI